MWLEKYFSMVNKDIEEATAALESSLPDPVRTGLEAELRRLQELNRVLSGDADKSVVHQHRAKLRWKRQELAAERDAAKKKRLEHEIAGIEADIKREVEKTKKK